MGQNVVMTQSENKLELEKKEKQEQGKEGQREGSGRGGMRKAWQMKN